jgi:alkaline phosphatase D
VGARLGGGATPIDRRAFLAGLVAAGLAAGCSGGDGSGSGGDEGTDRHQGDGDPAAGGNPGTEPAADLPPLPEDLPNSLFALGVASGDPEADSVILWTRLVADPLADGGGLPAAPVPVRWQVATDERFGVVVAEGDAVAEPAWAHSVHVDARGLDPDTWYWYRFTVGDQQSPVARTCTAPGDFQTPDRLRFAFASCQNRQDGYWGALEHLAAEDVDLVVFLGDYVYEDAPKAAAVRTAETPEPVDLAGYRLRYGEYKRDPLLQAAHARAPWVCTWDDHEVENNYAGEVGVPGGTGGLRDRRAAAYQAYYEHMPVRVDPPDGPDATLYRQVDWGGLARFFVLDTRQYRSDQACAVARDLGQACTEVDAGERTMLGEAQETWLGDALGASDARWNVLAQQVVVSKLDIPVGSTELVNLDQWDGYAAARRRLASQLTGVRNPLIVTGDIHASGVAVVTRDPDDPSSGALATELVGTSISSDFPAPFASAVEQAAEVAPAIRYVDARRRGYVVCEVTARELRADFRYVSTVTEERAEIATGGTWVVSDGDAEPVRSQADSGP